MRRWTAAALLALLAAGCGTGEGPRIIVAAGTTLVDSGFIERVVAEYTEQRPGADFSVVGVGSNEALWLAEQGSVDLTITHFPAAEDAFVREHPEAQSAVVFASRFVLVGPPPQAHDLDGIPVVAAFAELVVREQTFISRGDLSGTHSRELQLWNLAGVEPAGDWYVETGQAMGFTLQIADQRPGFTLSELGAFLGSEQLSLVDAGATDPAGVLDNPYTAIVPRGSPEAEAFVAWLISADGVSAIERANTLLFGDLVYRPPGVQS